MQARNLAEISCRNELLTLKCDEFFETADERKEFERQCPPSKEELQINGGDLGAICLGQMLNPTIDSIKSVAAFIATGMKASSENQKHFIAECETAPDFKAKILRTIPDYSGLSKDQIKEFSCAQLAGDFQANEDRQKDYKLGQRAEAAYRAYLSVSNKDEELEVGRNPFLAFIKHYRDKLRCLNQAGRYAMTCYGLFSVIDPTMLVGPAAGAAKGLRLVKLFRSRTNSEFLEIAKLSEPGTKQISLSKAERIEPPPPHHEEKPANSIAEKSKTDDAKNIFDDRRLMGELPKNNSVLSLDIYKAVAKKISDFKRYAIEEYGNPSFSGAEEASLEMERAHNAGAESYYNDLHSMGQGFEELLVDPGIVQNLEKFKTFMKSRNVKSAWEARELFAAEGMPQVTLYRGMALDDKALDEVLKYGIQSSHLRYPYTEGDIMFNQFGTNRRKTLAAHQDQGAANQSSFLSVTENEDVARQVAQSFASKSRKVRIFKIHTSSLNVIATDSLNGIWPPGKFDRKVESFMFYKISPDQFELLENETVH